jgi:hypothetical protein
MTCSECGEPMFVTDVGISHHGNDDEIHYGADADHVALVDENV